jgi:hypothetical protein
MHAICAGLILKIIERCLFFLVNLLVKDFLFCKALVFNCLVALRRLFFFKKKKIERKDTTAPFSKYLL